MNAKKSPDAPVNTKLPGILKPHAAKPAVKITQGKSRGAGPTPPPAATPAPK